MRKPIKKLTVEQLAARICMLPKDTEYNFSQEEDGSDYWGVIRQEKFDADYVLISYYGQAPTWVFDMSHIETYMDMVNELRKGLPEEFLWVFEE